MCCDSSVWAHTTKLYTSAAMLQDGVLSLSSANRYVGLPEGLHNHEPFAQLVRRASSRLQAEFDDLDAVWASDSMRQRFLDMPLPALLVRSLLPHQQSCTDCAAVAADIIVPVNSNK